MCLLLIAVDGCQNCLFHSRINIVIIFIRPSSENAFEQFNSCFCHQGELEQLTQSGASAEERQQIMEAHERDTQVFVLDLFRSLSIMSSAEKRAFLILNNPLK